MDSKKLKRLKRIELLEILVSISEENESLKKDISYLNARIESREIQISNAGTLADAAVSINGVFDAAQKAADQYLENIEKMNRDAQQAAGRILENAQRECEEMKRKAQSEVDLKWNDLNLRLEEYCSLHEELRSVLPMLCNNQQLGKKE